MADAGIDPSMFLASRFSVRLTAKRLNENDNGSIAPLDPTKPTVEPSTASKASSGTGSKRKKSINVNEDEIVVARAKRRKPVRHGASKGRSTKPAIRKSQHKTSRKTVTPRTKKFSLRPTKRRASRIPGISTETLSQLDASASTLNSREDIDNLTSSISRRENGRRLRVRRSGSESIKPESQTRSPRRARGPKKSTQVTSETARGSTSSQVQSNAFETPIRPARGRTSLPYGLLTPPDSQTAVRSPPPPKINTELLALSQEMSRREPLEFKPEPRGEPSVWADSRQALCETVPYFKMPQSGCHQNDRHVFAFLFDSVAGCREYMDSDVIIARAGGGMEADGAGGMHLRKHHDMQDAQVQAVLNDIAHENPLIIICGNRNESALCKMPHKYCVLGWYKPVAVWAEKTMGKRGMTWNIVKYRFERLDSIGGPAWHSPIEDRITEDQRQIAGDVTRASCRDCRQEFRQMYLVSWMCLNPQCHRFWKLNDTEQDADYGELAYHPAFLLDRTRWQNETEPYDVKPRIPDVGNTIGDNLTKINTRGICCPICGRCSPRRLFTGWKCDNPDCTFEFTPHHTPVKPQMLHNPWDVTGDGPSLAQNKFGPGVKVAVTHAKGYKIFQYTFEGIEGSLLHAVTNKTVNERARGPHEMFEAMQNEDLHLERRRFAIQRLTDGKPEDGDLMMAFSMNYGMPYKFVASGASAPFADSPWPVRVCRSSLNDASQSFLDPSQHQDFNELLIFAYMEGQKIEYHDDGEKGLGPRIATLSLGSKAKMFLRMKRKHYVGCSLQGVFTSDRPKPGGIDGPEMDHRRLAAWQALQPTKDTDRALYERRRREIPQELGLSERRNKWAPDLVTLTLHHGDIVLMEGYEIQQYLEHKVVPEGNLRFALTCRTVLEDHLRPDEKPAYEVVPDNGKASFL